MKAIGSNSILPKNAPGLVGEEDAVGRHPPNSLYTQVGMVLSFFVVFAELS